MCAAILDSWEVIYSGELQPQCKYMLISSIKLGQK